MVKHGDNIVLCEEFEIEIGEKTFLSFVNDLTCEVSLFHRKLDTFVTKLTKFNFPSFSQELIL